MIEFFNIGGTCSHAAAVLFYIEAAVCIRGQQTPTKVKAYWLIPKALGKLQDEEVCSTDFTSAGKRKRELDDAVSNISSPASAKSQPSVKTIQSSEEETFKFMEKLFENKSKAAVLTITEPFC